MLRPFKASRKRSSRRQEAFRLASARLGAGAGTQLDVLNAQVALTQASSTLLQALFSYNADLAEFDRATATQTIYSNMIDVKPGARSTTTQTTKKTTTTRTKAKTKSAKTISTPSPTAQLQLQLQLHANSNAVADGNSDVFVNTDTDADADANANAFSDGDALIGASSLWINLSCRVPPRREDISYS